MLKNPGSNPTETIDFFVILREQVCSMVNMGEGNLYVTCIKDFGPFKLEISKTSILVTHHQIPQP